MNGEHKNPWDDDLDMSLLPDYVLSSNGLYKVNRIACRPIWPSGDGQGIQNDEVMIELSWITPRGKRIRQWFHSSVRNDPKTLLLLPESPVTLENINQISTWLTVAEGAIRGDRKLVKYGRLATEKEILREERLRREEASRER